MWTDYFLCSSRMYFYFRIIHIRKYWKQIFLTSVTKVQRHNYHQYLRFRHQRLETLARKTCEIYSFFLKYHLLHQVNVLAHLLCHVTYVTAFNTCFNLVIKPAKSIFFIRGMILKFWSWCDISVTSDTTCLTILSNNNIFFVYSLLWQVWCNL